VSHAAGNSDAAHACQQGGYLTLHRADGTTFANEGQCVSYAAHDGTIVGVSACTVTSTTGCLTFNNATLPATNSTGNPLSGGNTITLTGSTSFVNTCLGLCYFTYPTNPNSLATGGGTYVEQDSTGAVVSQGIYRIADTAGSLEGLGELDYQDLTGNYVSSCAAATGYRGVAVIATLIDSSMGTTQTAAIGGITGVLRTDPPIPLPAASVLLTNGDEFLGTVSSSAMSLTC
jgi:hypothetical protein